MMAEQEEAKRAKEKKPARRQAAMIEDGLISELKWTYSRTLMKAGRQAGRRQWRIGYGILIRSLELASAKAVV